MLRALLPVGLLLAIVAVVVLVGCPPPAPKGQETPQEIPGGQGAEGPAGTVNAEAAPTSNAEAAAGAEAGAGDAKALAETKCGKCHPYAKATEEKRDAADWDKVVRTMAAKKAGWISDAEAKQIAGYLAANFAK